MPAVQSQGDPSVGMQCESPQEAAHRPASPYKPESTCTDGTSASIRPAADSRLSNAADCPEPSPTVIQLSRDERMVLGQKCKHGCRQRGLAASARINLPPTCQYGTLDHSTAMCVVVFPHGVFQHVLVLRLVLRLSRFCALQVRSVLCTDPQVMVRTICC